MGERTLAQAWESGRNHFNLIRLIAAWLVIYGHAWAITGTKGTDLIGHLVQLKFAGALAVDVFFVVSGFLIAASLQRNTVRGYLGSRALRILPALIVCVALSAFVMGPLLTTSADYWSAETWRYFFANASLWRAEFHLPGVFDGMPETAVNGSLWTLPVEARLYLLLLVASLLGVLTPKRFLGPWLVALVGIAIVAWVRRPLPGWIANYLWCVTFFITGVAAWLWRDRIRLSWIAIVVLLLLAAITRGTHSFPVFYFALVAYGTLWLAFASPQARLAHEHDLSYGLYLYGWPVGQLVHAYAPGSLLHHIGLTTLIALAFAALSWVIVERPALKLKKRFGTRTPSESPAHG